MSLSPDQVELLSKLRKTTSSVKAKTTAGSDTEAAINNLTQYVDKLELSMQDTQKQLATAKVTSINAQTKITELMSKQAASSTLDVMDESAIEKYLASNSSASLAVEVKRAILNGQASGLILHDPTINQEMSYWRNELSSTEVPSAAEGLKALQDIPTFSGDNTISWVSFEHPWQVAIRNRNLQEQTLRTALASKLKGAALTWYLSLEDVADLSFSDIMTKLRERYTNDSTAALNSVRGISQGPKEEVRDFSARLLLAARGLLPLRSNQLSVLQYPNGKIHTIPNPFKSEEDKEYRSKYQSALTQLTPYFLGGLRSDIRARLTADEYTDYNDIVKAACKAEWMNTTASSSVSVHNLSLNPVAVENAGSAQAECHAISDRPARVPYNRHNRPSTSSTYSTPPRNVAFAGNCFNCGVYGHTSRECQKSRSGRFTPYQNLRNNSRPRSHSRDSRDNRSSSFSRNRSKSKSPRRVQISRNDLKAFALWKKDNIKGARAKSPKKIVHFLERTEHGLTEDEIAQYELELTSDTETDYETESLYR
jgi:hypothetical protein